MEYDLKNQKSKVVIGILIGMFVIIIMILLSDIKKIIELIDHIQVTYLIGALLTVFVVYTGRFIKWQIYLKVLDISLKKTDSLKIFISGLCLSITPGRAGEVLKAYLLKKQFNIDFSLTAPTIVAERLSGLIGSITVLFIALVLLEQNEINYYIFIPSVTIIGIVFLVLNNKKIEQIIFTQCNRIKYLNDRFRIIHNLYNSASLLTRGRNFVLCCVISVIYWACECLVFNSILHSLYVSLDFSLVMMVITLSAIVGGLSMMPASLGVLEMGMVGLLQLYGVDYTTAALATLIHRLFILWSVVIIGMSVLITNRRTFKLM